MPSLFTEPLTVAAFAPFGQVISAGLKAGTSANQGTAQRFDFCADLITTRDSAKANLAVFSSVARYLPLEAKVLERHPCSTQVFLPLRCTRYLVCVAPTLPNGEPDLAGLRAFLCEAGVGIAYAPGTWHHPMVALDHDAEFAMLAWEDGGPRDCETKHLEHSWLVEAGPAATR